MDKTSNVLPDVQNLIDGRNIPIDRVGIRGLTVPLQVQSVKGAQPTVAKVCMCVGLPADKRGTHMSRFVSLNCRQPCSAFKRHDARDTRKNAHASGS